MALRLPNSPQTSADARPEFTPVIFTRDSVDAELPTVEQLVTFTGVGVWDIFRTDNYLRNPIIQANELNFCTSATFRALNDVERNIINRIPVAEFEMLRKEGILICDTRTTVLYLLTELNGYKMPEVFEYFSEGSLNSSIISDFIHFRDEFLTYTELPLEQKVSLVFSLISETLSNESIDNAVRLIAEFNLSEADRTVLINSLFELIAIRYSGLNTRVLSNMIDLVVRLGEFSFVKREIVNSDQLSALTEDGILYRYIVVQFNSFFSKYPQSLRFYQFFVSKFREFVRLKNTEFGGNVLSESEIEAAAAFVQKKIEVEYRFSILKQTMANVPQEG